MSGLEKYQLFVELAQEIQSHEAEVAYYVLLYYVNKGFELLNKQPDNQELKAEVVGKMEQLEAMKTGLGDPVPKDTYEGFLVTLFCQVDTEDRKEGSNGATAKKFRNCAKFIEAWNVMGPLQPAWEEKRKYCMWKASDIAKAIKAKQVPKRGGPGEVVQEDGRQREERKSSEPVQAAPFTAIPHDFRPAPLPSNPQLPAASFNGTSPPNTRPAPAQEFNTMQPQAPYNQARPQDFSTFQPQAAYPQPTFVPSHSQVSGGPRLTREQIRSISNAIKQANLALGELEFKKIKEGKDLIQQAIQHLSSF